MIFSLLQIFAVISIMMVIVSVTGMILGSTPEWQISSYNASAISGKLEFRLHSSLEFIELVRYHYVVHEELF